MKLKAYISLIICVIMLFTCGCSSTITDNSDMPISSNISSSINSSDLIENQQEDNCKISNNLYVHYIDVGQGDAIFIELPNNKTLLIDAGEAKYSQKVIGYIENLGYKAISGIIGTHPHSDHIGGLENVINYFEIGAVYMPKVSTNTRTFEDLLLAIKNKGLKITTAKKGLKIIDDGDLTLTVLSPIEDEYSNLNNYSVVVLLQYKNKRFLFTGDAEAEVEKALEGDISCDVLKVGHHGSSSSSTTSFLQKTLPDFAIISCGKDNIYGHPHKETIDKLKNVGAKYFTTQDSGDIVAVSNGNNLEIKTKNSEATRQETTASSTTDIKDVTYVLNVSSK